MESTKGQALYFEIGSEEIPAGYILPALESMARQMVRFLDENRVAHGEPYTTGTPRRLVLYIPDVAPHQEACTTEVVGPPKQVAYDKEGRPTKAAEGFARGQGVGVEDIRFKDTPKGQYLCIVREEAGGPTKDLLERMLPDFIAHIPFPKSMRWGSLSVTYTRPVRWIVGLLGGEILDFVYGDIQSGNVSYGHRFMSPAPVVVTDFESHKANLRERFVILDMAERREEVRKGVHEAARKAGGTLLEDNELLDEVTQIVEYPQPLVGEFEEKYLALPPELLITVIKKHQRYFAVTDAAGNLLNRFVTVAGSTPRDFSVVAAGNARVVRARLDDAQFYYVEDKKVPLDTRADQLKAVTFHSKLGTSWEKVERFTALAKTLVERVAPDCMDAVLRAALLCKADLVTGVVGEFPDLQGIMGRAYARIQGEPEAVAVAINEHYLPNRAGGPIPETMEGSILALADKTDTVVSCFAVGLIPSGTADPFALRRQTLGIIRIILEKPFTLSLSELIDKAFRLVESKAVEPLETVKQNVLDFFLGRLHHYLVSQFGYSPDVVEAALAVGIDDIVDAAARVKALAAFKTHPDFDGLAAGFKRVVNILKEPETTPVDAALLTVPAEQALLAALDASEGIVSDRLGRSEYDAAFETMARLKAPIDAFFDSVLVMDKDEAVKRNRLALLTRIRNLFARAADFRKIQTA